MENEEKIEIFSDGSCLGNPGAGGWCALLRSAQGEEWVVGGEAHTTNNRMELMAAVQGLEALKRPCLVSLTTDSLYVRDGINQWLRNWMCNGWRTASKKPVKNKDLWQRLSRARDRQLHVDWHWVRGHQGHIENERVDEEARRQAVLAQNDAGGEADEGTGKGQTAIDFSGTF